MKAKLSILLLSFGFIATGVAAQGQARADYERAQNARTEARNAAKPGTPEALTKARDILRAALGELDKPEVKERAEGNAPLLFRRHDIQVDLAEVLARLGDKAGALDALEANTRMAWLPIMPDLLEKNPAFESLRGEARYGEILDRMLTPARIWDTAAIATPYKEKLSVEERVAGLSLFWSEARHGFAHFDNAVGLRMDQAYMRFLTRVIQAETTVAYYRVMMELAALFKDGHTNVYPPRELQGTFFARPPMRTDWVDGKVIVTAVRSNRLAERVRVGDEVVAIDGEPVEDFSVKNIQPIVSASTPQDFRVRAFGYQLLMGREDKPVRLTLQDAAGRKREVSVERRGYDDVKAPPPFEFRMLPGNIAYFAVDHFNDDSGVKAFEAALPQILQARALILDVRQNGGGSTNHGLAILSYLTDRPIPASLQLVRSERSLERARGTAVVTWARTGSDRPFQRERPQRFAGKVIVLAGAQTFSAAEDFLVSYLAVARGEIVGEPTGGSTGQPLSFKLPGGGTARICVKRDSFPDGKAFVGKGIAPSHPVAPSLEDIRTGRDAALEKARELLG